MEKNGEGQLEEQRREARRHVAGELKAARQELRMTQEVLAKRAGTKKSNISRFESGAYNPSLDFLVKLAEGMDKKLEVRIFEKRQSGNYDKKEKEGTGGL